MARILRKIPNFKLPKYKMRDIEEIEELKVEYTPEDLEELKKRNSGEKSKDGYPGTEYKPSRNSLIKVLRNLQTDLLYLRSLIAKGTLRKSLTASSEKML